MSMPEANSMTRWSSMGHLTSTEWAIEAISIFTSWASLSQKLQSTSMARLRRCRDAA